VKISTMKSKMLRVQPQRNEKVQGSEDTIIIEASIKEEGNRVTGGVKTLGRDQERKEPAEGKRKGKQDHVEKKRGERAELKRLI